MAFYHGVKASEIATSVITPVSTTAGLPVVFGTAPVHLTDAPNDATNKPIICYSWKEAVAQLGYSADWKKYTLCETMYTQFQLYGVAPIVFVNVLDPIKHKKSSTAVVTLTNGSGTVDAPVLLNTLKVKNGAGATEGEINIDFTAAYNDDEQLVITVTSNGQFANEATLSLEYDEVDASLVEASDIIGGVDSNEKSTGLELLNFIYNKFSLVPGLVLAPGWSHKPTVAAVMKAKSRVINNLHKATIITDVDCGEVTKYTDAYSWKTKNNYTGVAQIVCWPMVTDGEVVYHMSNHILGIIGVMDAANDDIPYQSPSNRSMNCTGLCLADGTEVDLSLEQANLLNSQGIMTAQMFASGWVSWGNYTGAYPGNTDVKDTFICVRRMFDWDDQVFILTYWQKVDMPIIPRNIKSIIDSENIRLNSLVAQGYLLGARTEFLESENSVTDLLAGKIKIHKYRTPPVPAQEIESVSEYDVDYFKALFE